MGLVTWILIGVIVLVAIGLGVGVFFSGLLRGAEIVGQNPAVQNATEETKEFIDERVNVDVVIVTTSEATYSQGEPVTMTVKNNGDQTMTFPNAALGLEVEHVDSGKKYTVFAAQVITELAPGESKTITWEDSSAGPGKYTATVYTSPDRSVAGQTNFEITG